MRRALLSLNTTAAHVPCLNSLAQTAEPFGACSVLRRGAGVRSKWTDAGCVLNHLDLSSCYTTGYISGEASFPHPPASSLQTYAAATRISATTRGTGHGQCGACKTDTSRQETLCELFTTMQHRPERKIKAKVDRVKGLSTTGCRCCLAVNDICECL